MRITGRERRHKRITKKIKGDGKRPRLVVFRSNKHIYAQIVNDMENRVITGCSTLSKEFEGLKTAEKNNIRPSNKDGAKEIGKIIAQKALKLGINEIRFDRAGYIFHGRVKALAEGAKEGGLKF